MLHEEHAPPGSKNAPHFFKRSANLGNAAAGPCHHDCIDGVVGQRDTFGGAFKEVDGRLRAGPHARAPSKWRGRGTESKVSAALPRIERKIEARADADIE